MVRSRQRASPAAPGVVGSATVTPTTRIPLFPLGTVLFPGGLLPLHVFEERYRAMVRDLLLAPAESREFGVVAIRDGHKVGADAVRALHEIGCVARLRRVEPYADGRFDVVSSGVRRFRLLGIDVARPYLQGDVELLPEPDGAGPAELEVAAARVAMAFDEYHAALGIDFDLPDGVLTDAAALSYAVAAGVVLDLADKQALLEAGSTSARLGEELALLHREVGLQSVLPSLPAVALTRVPSSPN